jgi:hypothetical protein
MTVVSVLTTVVATACGTADETPTLMIAGDGIDELVLTSAAPATFYRALLECGAVLDFSEPEVRAALLGSRTTVSFSDGTTTGLVEAAIQDATGGPVDASEPSPVLTTAVAINGDAYDNCEAYAEQVTATSEPERVRAPLLAFYEDEISSDLKNSVAWREIDTDWSECMDNSGYPDLLHPGDEVYEVLQRLADVAHDDVEQLQQLLEFDRSITGSSLGCREDVQLRARRQAARKPFDEAFVAAHESQLMELIKIRESDPIGSS